MRRLTNTFFNKNIGEEVQPRLTVATLLSCLQVVNICVWVLASAFGVPAMVMGNVEEEQEHNSESGFFLTASVLKHM